MTIRKRIAALVIAAMMIFQVTPAVSVAEGGFTLLSNVVKGLTYHEVRFMDGESTVATQFVEDSAALVMPQNPTKDGFFFEGWFAGDTQVTSATAVTADMVIEARFRPILSYVFTVNYVDALGQKVLDSIILQYSEEADIAVNADGVKYVTVPSQEKIQLQEYDVYPDKASVTFLLDGVNTVQNVNVIYNAADAFYDVNHMVMGRQTGADGKVNFVVSGAQEIPGTRQTGLGGKSGAKIVPAPVDLTHYIYVQADALELDRDDATSQQAYVYYRPVEYALSYDTRDGSYIAPQPAYYGDTVALTGEVPTRRGYTFAGWYLDAELTNPASSSVVIGGNVTVHAKWEPARVAYTVVYLKQIYNNATGQKEYVFDSTRSMTGYVGATTSAPAGNTPAYYQLGSIDNVTIQADGSSVATVHYDLRTYTFTFDLSRRNIGTNWNPVYVTGTLNGSQSYSFQAVLGQNIISVWPSPASAVCSNSNYLCESWIPSLGGSNYLSNRYEVTADMLPSGSETTVTFTPNWISRTKTNIVQYWLQNTAGTGYEVSDEYSQVIVLDVNNGFNAKDLYGFTTRENTPSGYRGSGTYTDFTFDGKTYDEIYVYNFYYDRDQFDIQYVFRGQTLKTIRDVYFGVDITGAEYQWAPNPADYDLPEGAAFMGWWDNEERQGDPYHFTVMPGNNVILYAKFSVPDREVSYVPDQENPTVDTSTETVVYNDTVTTIPTPVKDGYIFLGWYTADGVRFDFEQPIQEDVTLYARWQKIVLEYTVRYLEEGTNAVLSQELVRSSESYTVGDVVTENALTIPGYRPEAMSKSFTLTGDNAKNILTIWYVKRADVQYTVHYYVEGTATPVKPSQTFSDTSELDRVSVIAPTNVAYNGQHWYPTIEVQGLELTSDPTKNVLTFYYLPYHTATVELRFFYDGVESVARRMSLEVIVGDSVNAGQYADDPTYTENGQYKFVSADPTNYTVTEALAGQTLVMNLRYETNIVGYTIHHYLEGTTIEVAPSEMGTKTVGDRKEVLAKAGSGEFAKAVFSSFGGNAIGESGNGYIAITKNAADNVGIVYYKLPVTLKANSATYTYDGTAKTVAGADGREYTVTGALSADAAKVTGRVEYYHGQTKITECINAGTYTAVMRADAAIPAYYIVNVENGLLTISKAQNPVELTVTGVDVVYDGQPHQVSVGGVTDGDTVYFSTTEFAQWSQNNPRFVEIITGHPVQVLVTNPNYADRTGEATVTIRPRPLTVYAETTLVYNGSRQSFFVTSQDVQPGGENSGLVPGETFTLAGAEIHGTDVGAYTAINEGMSYSIYSGSNPRTPNYTVTITGKMTITPKAVAFTGESGEREYVAGHTWELTGITASGLVTGHTWEGLSYLASGMEQGSYEGSFTGEAVLKDASGADVTANYTVAKTPGTLVITHHDGAIPLVFASKEKVYDGQALYLDPAVSTDDSVTIVYQLDGVEYDSITAAALGRTDVDSITITAVATSPNYLNPTTATATLTVRPRIVTLTSSNASKMYDGTPLMKEEVTVGGRGFVEGEGAAYSNFASITDFGRIENSFDYTLKEGTKAENYTITKVYGYLAITKVSPYIIVIAGSSEHLYDGTEHTEPSYTAVRSDNRQDATSLLAPGDRLVVANNGKITNAGFTRNFPISVKVMRGDTDVSANYNLGPHEPGWITVTPRTLNILGNSAEKTYNGLEQMVEGFTIQATGNGLASGDQLDSAADFGHLAHGVNAGTYPGAFEGTLVIRNTAGSDVTANYTVTKTPGQLVITQATAPALVATDTTVVYDGFAYGIGVSGAVPGDTLFFSLVGGESASDWTTAAIRRTDVTNGLPIFVKAENPNYLTRYADAVLTITPRPLKAEKTSTFLYNGTAQGHTLTQSDVLPAFAPVVGEMITLSASHSAVEAGTHHSVLTGVTWKVLRGSTDVTHNYTLTAESTISITKRPVTFTGESGSRVYTGAIQQLTGITPAGLASGHTWESLTYKAEGLEAGTYAGYFTGAALIRDASGADVTRNYAVENIPGELIITKYLPALNIKANSAEKTYDGKPLTESGFTVSGGSLQGGDTLEVTIEGSVTNANLTIPNRITGYRIVNASGRDVTASYTIGEITHGTLLVHPRKITFKSPTAEKVYDGLPLTAKEIEIISGEADGIAFVGNEGAIFDVTGTQTDVGSSVNTFTAAPKDGTNAANYAVTYIRGTLTVTKDMTSAKLTVNGYNGVYDGNPHSVSGETVTGAVEGTVWTYTYSLTGESGSWTSDKPAFTDVTEGETVYVKAVNPNYGDLTASAQVVITRRPVTLNSGHGTKVYDGTPLTNHFAWVSQGSFVEGEGVAVYNYQGSQTRVGSSKNHFTYILNSDTKPENYIITKVPGTLTVTGDSIITDKTTPEVESNYGLGDAIPFTITVENVNAEALTNVIVVDENAQILPGEGYTVSEDKHTATIDSIASGASVVIQAQHIVTLEDLLAAIVENTATVTWEDEIHKPTAETDDLEDIDTTLEVVKTSDVAEGAKVKLGDVITYTIAVTNKGNVPFTNVKVVDEMVGLVIAEDEVEENETPEYTVDGSVVTIETLEIGQTVTITATYEVTVADMIAGKILNAVTAEGDPVDENDPDETTPNDEDEEEDETEELDTTLEVIKTSDVAEDAKVKLGDVITYTIAVTNKGNVPYSNVLVTDDMAGLVIAESDAYTVEGAVVTIETLEIGQTVTITATYEVTVEDMIAGKILNAVTAEGDPVDEKDPDETTPKDEDEEEDDTEEPVATLLAEKKILGVKDGEGYLALDAYRLGQEVHFLLRVTNTGNLPYKNIQVTDPQTGLEETIPALAPGESAELETSFTVSVEHILSGRLFNQVTAKAEVDTEEPDPDLPDPEDEDEVEAPTVPENYARPLGEMVMNVGDCFE